MNTVLEQLMEKLIEIKDNIPNTSKCRTQVRCAFIEAIGQCQIHILKEKEQLKDACLYGFHNSNDELFNPEEFYNNLKIKL